MEVTRRGREKGDGEVPSTPEGTEIWGPLFGSLALALQSQVGIFAEVEW